MQISEWMVEAGLTVREDAIGNVRGRMEGRGGPTAPTLYIGSHYDTVYDAGQYDGQMGVIVGESDRRHRIPNVSKMSRRYRSIALATPQISHSLSPSLR